MSDRPIIVRVPDALRLEIESRAKANDRSLSQEVRRLLTREFAPKEVLVDDAATER